MSIHGDFVHSERGRETIGLLQSWCANVAKGVITRDLNFFVIWTRGQVWHSKFVRFAYKVQFREIFYR